MTQRLYGNSEITEFRKEQEEALKLHLISNELLNIFRHPGKYVVTRFSTPELFETLGVGSSEIISEFYSSENNIPTKYQTLSEPTPFLVSRIPSQLEQILDQINIIPLR